jgi:hypothetical protein
MNKIMQAQQSNDDAQSSTGGVRLGYMGHLTYISDEVCKLIEKCSLDLSELTGTSIHHLPVRPVYRSEMGRVQVPRTSRYQGPR